MVGEERLDEIRAQVDALQEEALKLTNKPAWRPTLLPTVTVAGADGAAIIINKSDYDPDVHELVDADADEPEFSTAAVGLVDGNADTSKSLIAECEDADLLTEARLVEGSKSKPRTSVLTAIDEALTEFE